MKEVWYIRIAGFLTGFFLSRIVTTIMNKNYEAMIYSCFVVVASLLLARAEYKVMTKNENMRDEYNEKM
jgi:hypothetical protein